MRGTTRWRRLAAAAMAVLLCAGCAQGKGDDGSTDPGDGSTFFVDALDREVFVENPRRVVAMMGGFAETWLLAGGELAGVTEDAVSQRGLDLSPGVGVVGQYNSPSVESVLTLEPDLVLLSAQTPAHVALLEVLDNAGVRTAYFDVNTFEDYLRMLSICTQITGRPDLYEEHGVAVQRQIREILARGPGKGSEEGPEVLLLITYSGGAVAQDSTSMTGAMLRELGCRNLADRYPGALSELGVEQVLAEDPDYILVVPMGGDDDLARRNLLESVESHPAWGTLTAVREGRYLALPKELFLYKPNARWGESYAYLAEILGNRI